MRNALRTALLLSLSFTLSAQSKEKPDALTQAWWNQTVALSNDKMEGRDTGTQAYERAAKYVADQFAAAGLKPAGDNGTFFQRVPMHQIDLVPDKSSVEILDAQGKVSVAATLRAMARTSDGRSSLVEIKAVDDNYPLYGAVTTDTAMPLSELLAQRDGAFGAAVDPALLTRLDLKIGDRVNIGAAAIELRAALSSEPDKLSGSIGLGPRVLMSTFALQATGLVQPGSLVRWQYRLRLPDANASDSAVAALQKQAEAKFPDAGWQIRSRNKASPQLERSVERFTQFLTLVGLTTLLVGGVGVANAVAAHLARKRDAIGTMKAPKP